MEAWLNNFNAQDVERGRGINCAAGAAENLLQYAVGIDLKFTAMFNAQQRKDLLIVELDRERLEPLNTVRIKTRTTRNPIML